MNEAIPHYLLYSETHRGDGTGRWRFVLRAVGGPEHLEAADAEPDIRGERLELLTVVRALEALDQPSRVTLMTSDPYVRQGIRFGLPEWRSNGWQWEFYGQMVPIKHLDLWQRLDRALAYHRIEFCRWRVDSAHSSVAAPKTIHRSASGHSAAEGALRPWLPRGWVQQVAKVRTWWHNGTRRWRRDVTAAPSR